MDKEKLVRLCTRFQNGDVEAYKELYSTCYLPVYRFIYGIVGRVEDTEDIVQDSFLKVGKSISYFKGGNVLAWLFTIARNTMYDSFRKKKRVLESDQDQIEKVAVENDRMFEGLDLEPILSMLSLQEREMIMLKYWQEYNMKEIAQVVGKSHDAVRKEMSRVMKKMRNITPKKLINT